ncbi:DUF3703 domain-containing protein [Variovorax sp. JS1663]|uniref:DUF3703 domain-containing protein n=1 Tax=Variovorax sp. JS1663 TaxID=1851577 RepID=UPI003FD02AB6
MGQRNFKRHWQVHAWMLWVGMAQRNFREVMGQVFRLVLVHLWATLPGASPGKPGACARKRIPAHARAAGPSNFLGSKRK